MKAEKRVNPRDMRLCNRPAPAEWRVPQEDGEMRPAEYCVLKEGHEVVSHVDNAGNVCYTSGHVSQFGRRWPIGNKNTEYL